MLALHLRPAIARLLMILCCIGALCAPAMAQAQKKAGAATATAAPDPNAKPTEPQALPIPWLVNCASVTGQMACEAEQTLTIKKTGQVLLKVSVRVPEKSENGAMMIQLPHGMFLPDGVTLAVDGKAAKKEPIQTCDPKGCYVGLPLDAALLKDLESGKALSVTFKDLKKNDIKIPVSLSGFKEAYAKLM